MPAPSLPTTSTTSTPSALTLLGPPPLNPGDDPAGYATLLARLVAEVGPTSVIEETCVREVAEMMWEAARLRRLKAKLMTISAGDAVREVLQVVGVEFFEADHLAKRWAARELAAVGEVDELLNAAGLDMHHVMAKTLELRIDKIERFDRMAAGAESRRAGALREMLLFRDPDFAARLRRAVESEGSADDAVVDGEIARLVAPPGAPSAAPQGAVEGAT
ncbi:MAG TPA: hypothetical protein VGG01_05140 [Xanthobacteraceae bacterium]|jgi:hypothetical protein